jgi:hypothetical protein
LSRIDYLSFNDAWFRRRNLFTAERSNHWASNIRGHLDRDVFLNALRLRILDSMVSFDSSNFIGYGEAGCASIYSIIIGPSTLP